jgi:hypothetical protein
MRHRHTVQDMPLPTLLATPNGWRSPLEPVSRGQPWRLTVNPATHGAALQMAPSNAP